jgi:transcriptional regulator with XRE-family HTH domain
MDEVGIKDISIMFGSKLTQVRELQRMSRQALSTKTDIDLITLINIENGLVDFPIEYVFIILKALNITPSQFFVDFE